MMSQVHGGLRVGIGERAQPVQALDRPGDVGAELAGLHAVGPPPHSVWDASPTTRWEPSRVRTRKEVLPGVCPGVWMA